jgi:hypothetical protein
MKQDLQPEEACRLAALHSAILAAENDIALARDAIDDLTSEAGNNVYDSLEDAQGEIEDALHAKASDACEGSHCMGLDEYHQMFMVDGQVFKATMKCDYDRHDKRYYYVYATAFSVEKVSA